MKDGTNINESFECMVDLALEDLQVGGFGDVEGSEECIVLDDEVVSYKKSPILRLKKKDSKCCS